MIFGHRGPVQQAQRPGRHAGDHGVATFAIGLLPTYETAGVLAPALLVVLRVLQGTAAGGEWGGAVLMISENVPAERRGFLSAWSQAGLALRPVVGVFLLAGDARRRGVPSPGDGGFVPGQRGRGRGGIYSVPDPGRARRPRHLRTGRPAAACPSSRCSARSGLPAAR
ncbi:MHS family MFS transporter [Pseudonocardia sp. MCCB 268]|nr:MHS family MFS transporter [Pseudonocardia cytotoxica]